MNIDRYTLILYVKSRLIKKNRDYDEIIEWLDNGGNYTTNKTTLINGFILDWDGHWHIFYCDKNEMKTFKNKIRMNKLKRVFKLK